MISVIRPTPETSASMTSFGFSVEHLPADQVPADFFQELPERFSAAELPGYQFDFFQTEGLMPVHGCSLIEQGILENLPLQQSGLLRECITGLNRSIESLAKKGISTGILNLDLNTILSPEQEKLYLTILRGAAYTLEQNDFTILLPFSIPAASADLIRQASGFLRKSLLPQVKIRLDIHAHELNPGFSPDELAGILFPEIRSIRFLYLADAGNVLIPEHILPWISSLAKYGFHGPCFIAPAANSCDGLPAWISANEALVKKLENSSGE